MLYVSDSEIQALLRNFYLLTGIKICICDNEHNYNVVISRHDFCDSMASDPRFHQACLRCDRRARAICDGEKREWLYRCHAGFWEYITPLIFDGVVVGHMATGMITDGTPEEHDLIRERLQPYGIEGEAFEALYAGFPHRSMEQIRAACSIIETCVGYIYHYNLIRATNAGIVQNVSRYITDHIAEDLTAETLCKAFSVSKSELYKEFNEYFHKGVAEYIRDKRLAMACRRMESGDGTISEIAASVGYDDYNYFAKVFRRIYGVSPREYRKSFLTP